MRIDLNINSDNISSKDEILDNIKKVIDNPNSEI